MTNPDLASMAGPDLRRLAADLRAQVGRLTEDLRAESERSRDMVTLAAVGALLVGLAAGALLRRRKPRNVVDERGDPLLDRVALLLRLCSDAEHDGQRTLATATVRTVFRPQVLHPAARAAR